MTYALTHPYWPMSPNPDGSPRWCEYVASSITGVFDPVNYTITRSSAVALPASNHRRTFIQNPNSLAPQTTIVYTDIGVSCPPNWRGNNNTLVQGLGNPGSGAGFIGENGNFGAWGVPTPTTEESWGSPEPQLPLVITDYMTPITGVHEGWSWDRNTGAPSGKWSMPWRFKNFGLGPYSNDEWLNQGQWAQYPNQVKTYLEEFPDTFTASDCVYQYYFAENVGMLCQVFGTRDRNNNVIGWMFQLSAHS